MISRPRRKIISNLTSKGFQEAKSDHHKLVLYVEGKKAGISTKVSRGSKYSDVPEGLLRLMKQQIRLGTLDQFLQLIDCPMSGPDYVGLLIKEGKLGSSKR